ncbi:MAG TPA: DNA primase [Stellaceae bacterium]|nr:DNA primase [Stellaceae bacterium]
MAFPPRFLDELRQRCSLADIVGRRVRLTKRGREYVGLCPFHNEKTPSFAVVEDKGFFHCFGCGAHGDVIGFLMQSGGLGFREAVESLAGEAGLEVPKSTPQERERAQRQIDLQDAMEAACVFFQAQLEAPAGRAGLAYLQQRGLDAATIRRFRLGFAPEGREALKRALAGKIPEALLVEGGLLRKPEDGGATYDYFRNRVIFPIGDRGGRVIAFGGRVIGEGQPKYLNSPETPLFQKGRVLYGWAAARASAAKAPSAIVTEGYMDVIALHRAGFTTAVAPLGTALTETQIEELWKLAPEPILCFDGDAAGERAALRAADRALPLLKPGLSLRFAALPAGEDPDTLIARYGAATMQEALDQARPLAEVIWAVERKSDSLDTPERRAALEQRLEAKTRLIADKNVADKYRRFFRERLFATFASVRRGIKGRGSTKLSQSDASTVPQRPPEDPDPRKRAQRRQEEVLVATFLMKPALLHDLAEDFVTLDLIAPDLDKLRRGIINTFTSHPDLDAAALRLHLCQDGFDRAVDELLSPQIYVHAAFARPEVDIEAARSGWLHLRDLLNQVRHLAGEMVRAGQGLAEDTTDAPLAQLDGLRNQWKDELGDAPSAMRPGGRAGG